MIELTTMQPPGELPPQGVYIIRSQRAHLYFSDSPARIVVKRGDGVRVVYVQHSRLTYACLLRKAYKTARRWRRQGHEVFMGGAFDEAMWSLR